MGRFVKYGGKAGKMVGGMVGAKLGSPMGATGQFFGRKAGEYVGKRLGQAGARTIQKGAVKVIASLKKGGKIRKTGLYRLHKGERVIPYHRKSHQKKKYKC